MPPPVKSLTQEVTIKVGVVGRIQSGKTALLKRLRDFPFPSQYHSTLATNFGTYVRKTESMEIIMHLWDIAGEIAGARDHKLRVYLNNPNAIVICCDLTSRESFNDINTWHTAVSEQVPTDTPIFLMGTKMDDLPNQVVTQKELEAKATQLNLQGCYFTSAKTGEEVKEAFDDIAKKITLQATETATLAATADNSNLTVADLKKTYRAENGGGWLATQLIFGCVFQNTRKEVVRKLKERAANHPDGASAKTLSYYDISFRR